MPIYEYRCANCHRKVSIFWRSFSAVDESKALCTFCGSSQLSRLASRVRVIRGGGGSSGDAGDAPDVSDGIMNELGGLDENDPRSLGHFMRKMAAQTGEELGPEFDEVVGRLEKGEDPEKIEQSMGDLFGEPGGSDDMMDDGMPSAPVPGDTGEPAEKPTAGSKQAGKTVRRAVRPKAHNPPKAKSKAGNKTARRT